MKNVFFIFIALISLHCNRSRAKVENDEQGLNQIEAYDYSKGKAVYDTIYNKYPTDIFNKVTLKGIDTVTKCNLTTARYMLKNVIKDSIALGHIITILGYHILNSARDKPGCIYPVMCVVYLYSNEEDYKIRDNIASFSKTPSTGIDIYVSSRKLNEMR